MTLSLKCFNPENPQILKILLLTVPTGANVRGEFQNPPLTMPELSARRYGRRGMGRLVWFSVIWSVSHSLAKL